MLGQYRWQCWFALFQSLTLFEVASLAGSDSANGIADYEPVNIADSGLNIGNVWPINIYGKAQTACFQG